MSALKDRLRRATAGLGLALGGRRPGVELVRVDQPEGLAPPAPQPLRALPAPTDPICQACGQRHPQPLRRPRGLAAYRQIIAPDGWVDDRPQPLGQSPDADLSSLIPRRFNPWRY